MYNLWTEQGLRQVIDNWQFERKWNDYREAKPYKFWLKMMIHRKKGQV